MAATTVHLRAILRLHKSLLPKRRYGVLRESYTSIILRWSIVFLFHLFLKMPFPKEADDLCGCLAFNVNFRQIGNARVSTLDTYARKLASKECFAKRNMCILDKIIRELKIKESLYFLHKYKNRRETSCNCWNSKGLPYKNLTRQKIFNTQTKNYYGF